MESPSRRGGAARSAIAADAISGRYRVLLFGRLLFTAPGLKNVGTLFPDEGEKYPSETWFAS